VYAHGARVSVKVVSTRLGHATAAFTQDVYMQAIEEDERSAPSSVAAVVFGTESRASRSLEPARSPTS
jgi:integrase